MLHPFEVDPDYFGLLRARTQSVLDSDPQAQYPAIDAGMRSIVEFVHANFPNLTTVFSCEGHPQDALWNSPYIMFAATEGGVDKLALIFRAFMSRITFNADKVRTGVSIQDYGLKLTYRITPFEGNTWYPVIILQTDTIANKEHRAFILKHLQDALAAAALPRG